MPASYQPNRRMLRLVDKPVSDPGPGKPGQERCHSGGGFRLIS